MSRDSILAVLLSPVGWGAAGAALLALALLVAPAPRRAVSLRWSLAGLGMAAVSVMIAVSMAAIGNAWQAGGVVLMLGATLAVAALWLGHAPGPHDLGGCGRSDPDEDGGGGGRVPAPPPAPPSPSIDWDAFDRAREEWSRLPA